MSPGPGGRSGWRIAQLTNPRRALRSIEKSLEDFDNRLWDLEEKILGEELSDGNVYVRRRRPARHDKD